MDEERRQVIFLRVTPDLKKQLLQISDAQDQNLTATIKRILHDHVAEHAQQTQAQTGHAR